MYIINMELGRTNIELIYNISIYENNIKKKQHPTFLYCHKDDNFKLVIRFMTLHLSLNKK